MRLRLWFFIIFVGALPLFADQASGVKKRRPLPDEFGNVVINNFSQKNNVAPVVFSHWFHRSKYTCRLCHVDIGFAMEANGTRIREEDNRKGLYCGACHNGKYAFASQTQTCDRCHSQGKEQPNDFAAVTGEFPRGRFGNNIDWEQAELAGKVKLIDTLPEVSVKRRPLELQKDYSIDAKIDGLPQIIFSHKKHAVWSGCELCHPEVFSVKTGSTKYTMQDIFAGKYCGLCHGSAAFPATDCQRCHVKPV